MLHHPVISDTKNTKMRIVFDSTAKFKGVLLNDLLEKGPNLLSDLTGILLRFRGYKYAVAGDISNIFFQILLNPDDQVFHRFRGEGIPSRSQKSDLLQSCTCVAEAKDIVKGTCEVLEKVGFQMHNWISNDQKILEEMTEERKKDVKQLGEAWQQVLRLHWEPMSDTFTFRR